MYAVHQGTYVLKLIGEIRVPICATLDGFIETIFQDSQLHSVLIDLSETHVIDSTALGLLAKIAIQSSKRLNQKPCIITSPAPTCHILDSMGFDQVFNVIHEAPVKSPQMSEVPSHQPRVMPVKCWKRTGF
ncbi:MAG: STAS domain-containing protein [Gammaproteobacteria bacterium]